MWHTAMKDEADARAAAGEDEKNVFEAAGNPTRIAGGDVRIVPPPLLRVGSAWFCCDRLVKIYDCQLPSED